MGMSGVSTSQGSRLCEEIRFPKLAAMMDDAEHEILTCMSLPKAHRVQIHSTNRLEGLNAEVKRRTNVIGIVPSDKAIIRLVGVMMLEQNDEWSLQRRDMQRPARSLPASTQTTDCLTYSRDGEHRLPQRASRASNQKVY